MTNLTTKSAGSYVQILRDKNEPGFLKHIIAAGIKRTLTSDNADVEVLDLSEQFFSLNRRTPNEDYYTIGKILRKAAHILYRNFNKINKNRQKSDRFLHLV